MDMEIKNRIEAFLSWKTSGIKPAGWDLEPQNKQEMWIAEEAKRLDSIEFGEDNGEKLRKSPTKAASTNDYNELENIPILPISASLVEGEYYYQPAEQSYKAWQVGDSIGIGDVIHFDMTKGTEVETYLNSLNFDPQSSPMIFMMTTSRMNVMLIACDFSFIDPTVEGYGIMFQNGQDISGFIYSTVACTLHMQTGDRELVQGFQTDFIGLDGNITLDYAHDTVSTLVEDALPELWNGVFVFKAEVTPNVIGQIIHNELVPFALRDSSISATYYRHNFELAVNDSYMNDIVVRGTIINDNNTSFNINTLDNYLITNGYVNFTKWYPITGYVTRTDSNKSFAAVGLISTRDGRIGVLYYTESGSLDHPYFNLNNFSYNEHITNI